MHWLSDKGMIPSEVMMRFNFFEIRGGHRVMAVFRLFTAGGIHFMTAGCIMLLFFCCAKPQSVEKNDSSPVTRWEFNDLNGWVDGSQNTAGPDNYAVQNGKLRIFTRPETWDRAKVHTVNKRYGAGKYTWRIFIPTMGIGDQASIGAFLYHSDEFELDFEVGYGTAPVRQRLRAGADELIVYCTSQANPYQSVQSKVKREQWYDLTLDLDVDTSSAGERNYHAVWLVDQSEIAELNLSFGEEKLFYIFCSVENLKFLGDHIPHQLNYALFDFVEFEPHESHAQSF